MYHEYIEDNYRYSYRLYKLNGKDCIDIIFLGSKTSTYAYKAWMHKIENNEIVWNEKHEDFPISDQFKSILNRFVKMRAFA